MGQWDRAVKELDTHTFHRWEAEFGMRSAWVNVNLGQGAARFDAGDYAGAVESFLRALEYPSNLRIGRQACKLDARTHWCLACAYEKLGDSASAQPHWKEATAELPPFSEDLARFYGTSGPDVQIYRAVAMKKLGRADEAENDLTTLVERLRAHTTLDDVETAFFLGLALKALGRDEEAAASLHESLKLYPWQPRAQRLVDGGEIL